MRTCSNCGAGGRTKRHLCDLCYERLRARETAYGWWEPRSTLVPAEPVREHVRQLCAADVSIRQLSALSGVSRTSIVVLMRGKVGGEVREHLWRSTADRLLAVSVPESPVFVPTRTDLILAVGSTRRLQALVAAGWTQTYLAGRLGISGRNLYPLIHGRRRQLTVRRAQQVLELWAELELVRGPSNAARRYGADMRWALPMQWAEDDLDDPTAGPDLAADDRVRGAADRKASAAAEYQHARGALGMSNDQAVVYVARGVGVTLKTLRVWGFDTARAEEAARTPEQAERRRLARNARRRREAAA